MNDPTVHALGAAVEAWRDLLGQVTAAQLTLATPNPGWDVAKVIQHVIAVTGKFTVFALGVTDQPRTPGYDLISDDHRAAFNYAADRALAAWQCADLRRRCYLPFGTFTADLAAGINLQLRCWVSDAEVAETQYTAFTSKKGQAVTARLIVRRVRDLNKQAAAGQDELFPAWRYHAVFTGDLADDVARRAQAREVRLVVREFRSR